MTGIQHNGGGGGEAYALDNPGRFVNSQALNVNWTHAPDGDGLPNFDEYRYCTSPATNDTDGDGVSDGDEIPHSPGSCPNDASDSGDPANCVTLRLTVGDPSGSHSERWNLNILEYPSGRLVYHHCDGGFGTPGSAEYALVKGKAYAFRLRWVATNLGYNPDFDWRCLVNDSNLAGARPALYGTGAVIVEDPDQLLTEETHGNDTNITLGREGRIIVPKVEFSSRRGRTTTSRRRSGKAAVSASGFCRRRPKAAMRGCHLNWKPSGKPKTAASSTSTG